MNRWTGRSLVWLALCSAPLAATPMPDTAGLVGRTTAGAVVDLVPLRGKVVLVYFWSTNCAVCLDQLPELRRNLAGWRGQPFEVVAVNQDRAMADLKAYEQALDRVVAPHPQMRVVWRHAAGHVDTFGPQPDKAAATWVLDRTGRVVKTLHGRWPAALWDDIAELVLN